MTVGGRGGGARSYDRWGKGGGGGGGAGGVGRPATLGPSGQPLWASEARHSGPVRSSFWARPTRHLGPSGQPSIKPVGWPRALKKIKFRPGSLTVNGPIGPARTGPRA